MSSEAQRNRYTPQNKSLAVGLVFAGKSVVAVARTLNIPHQTLSYWVKLERRLRLLGSKADSRINQCDH